jgi:SAM-dependent methyltransferase
MSPGAGPPPDHCRLCGGTRLASLGRIDGTDFFAGRVLPRPLPAGWLWRCADCESLFRHPVLEPATYARLYENGAADQWHGDSERLDLATVRATLLERAGELRVLDVGCGNGDFLDSLPARVARSGIEPSTDAAAHAQQRGIRVVAPAIESLPADARFDAITIIDVIEHLPEPRGLLERACAHLAPGGMVIVSTGDPLCPAWRRYGAKFWYSSFPEHLTFPSRKFFATWARDSGSVLAAHKTTRYRRLPAWLVPVYLLIQLVYAVHPRLLDWTGRVAGVLLRWPAPRRRYFSPGVAGLFVDHQVIVLRRTD